MSDQVEPSTHEDLLSLVSLDVASKDDTRVLRLGKFLHVRSEADWEPLIARMTQAGYKVEPSEHRPDMLTVTLDSDRCSMISCGHCGAISSRLGSHNPTGKWCSSCGGVQHYDLAEGEVITLSFSEPRPGESGVIISEFRFKLLDYDEKADILYLAAAPLADRYLDEDDPEGQASAVRELAKLQHFLPLLEQGECTTRSNIGRDIVHVKRAQPLPALVVRDYRKDKFGPPDRVRTNPFYVHQMEHRQPYHKSSRVTVFDGVTYGKGMQAPTLPSVMYLSPAFRLYPLEPNPDLHNQIIRMATSQTFAYLQSYFVQERSGQPYKPHTLDGTTLGKIRTFVDNFTTLDIEKWDEMMAAQNGKHSALTLLAMAEFCHPEPVIMTGNERYSGAQTMTLGAARLSVDRLLGEMEEREKAERKLEREKQRAEFTRYSSMGRFSM